MVASQVDDENTNATGARTEDAGCRMQEHDQASSAIFTKNTGPKVRSP